MSMPLRTIVAFDGGGDQKTVETIVGDPGIEIVAVLESHGELSSRRDLDADVVLVIGSGHSEVVLAYVAEVARERPDWPTVVATFGTPNGNLRDLFGAGADDVVVLADSATPGADTFFALQKAVARHRGSGAATDDAGSLICVLGPKGGTGKTLTTANLGSALADAGHRVVAVDLDLQFGDLAITLGVPPERTVYDLVTSGGTLDADKVDAFLASTASGLQVLLAPMRPDQAAAITVDFLRELYPVLRSAFDFVVVDTPPGFTPEVIATIDASTAICMVGMLDAPSLKNTKLGLETLELMGVPSSKLRILLNRADTSVDISHSDVVQILGRAPDTLVPSQREVVRSVNRGEPIVLSGKRSEPARAFRALADLYASQRPVAVSTNGAVSPRGRKLLRRS